MMAGDGRPLIQPSVLLYDWDNTLVDAWAGIAAALNVVFAEFDKPLWSIQETKQRVRRAMNESFPLLFGDEWERARDLFLVTFREQHLQHVRPMPGAEYALIAGAPWPQGVVSNKNGPYVRAEVTHLAWDGHFGAVVGAGDASADKPDPAPIRFALERLGSMPGRSVWYIGDTALDMATARAAGATAVLIGDAAHDGGIDRARPDLHFPSAFALAERLRAAK